jgi:hypothetical protein
MKLVTDPGLDRWPEALRRRPRSERDPLISLAQSNAALIAAAPLTRTAPLIATGHQAALWHPGILAKDIAAARAATRLHAGVVHLVVDQDVNAALSLDLPVLREDRLDVLRLALAPTNPQIPTGSHRPVDRDAVLQTLAKADEQLGSTPVVDLEPLSQAWRQIPRDLPSLAAQVTAVLLQLLPRWTGPMPVIFASQLRQAPAFTAAVQRMLQEPRACATTYNVAARRHPDAGIAPLRIEQDRIELPLWLTEFDQPRQRVFADLADRSALLVSESGRTLDPQRDALAPRALLLTALWRDAWCDLFVHGTGGGVYDRVTEDWWQAWLNRPLAMKAVVTADVTLPLAAPLADETQLRQAQWRLHHLPHNLDRELKLDSDTARRKRQRLAHMDDDRDPARRRESFDEIHAINAQLAAEHAGALHEARQQLQRARAGVANRRLAARRDWFFGLYPHDRLAPLAAAIDERLAHVAAVLSS